MTDSEVRSGEALTDLNSQQERCVIIGAGPAGLTAAYEFCKLGIPAVVFEQDDVVGGLAQTVNYKGYRFDIGGHRFFTKVDLVHEWWEEVLGNDFLRRPRLSRIYYGEKLPSRATAVWINATR